MDSVRNRLEKPLREAPEKVVPTDSRRVALASGPTMSTRQQADFAGSQHEIIVRPTAERTTAASCDFGNGDGFSRVRDRVEITQAMKPEVAGPKTTSQLVTDALAEFNRRQAEEAAAEARAYATGKKVDAYQRKIAEAIAEAKAADARLRGK